MEKAKKPIWKKWWAWVIVVIVVAGAAGALLGADCGPFNAVSPSTEQVLSGSGEVIGTRMVAEIGKAEAQTATQEEFCAWVDKYVSSDYQYVTVDFGDGTGLVFTGGSKDLCEYGELDDAGRVVTAEQTFVRSGDSYVER